MESELEILEDFDFASFQADSVQQRRPALITGAVADWPALQRWSPEFFAARHGQVEITPSMQLPGSGVPYQNTEADHRRQMTVAEFVGHLESGERCYMDQSNIECFPGLAEDFSFEGLIPEGPSFISLWLGSRTRSGLHYDNCDNFLVQLHGRKDAILVAPEEGHRVYPFGDNVSKSRVDPEDPDLKRFPKFRDARTITAQLQPGQMLFIPRGWWHFLSTPAASISLNCWFGCPLTVREQAQLVFQAGSRVWMRVLGDFVWHGVLRRPFQQRLYSAPPTGQLLYQLLFGTARSESSQTSA